MTHNHAFMTGAVLAAALSACSSDGLDEVDESVGVSVDALNGQLKKGKRLFEEALPYTNGRSCADCHAAEDHMALSPASIEARFQADPSDPLFHALDADDPDAATLTFDHLRQKGLVRVTLTLAANLDVIDENGDVVTNADRTLVVWRGVPTIENVALTGPFLSDGRAGSLAQQVAGALQAHSQITQHPSASKIDGIVAYEETVFSSPSVAAIFAAVSSGQPPPDPDPEFAPDSNEAAGKVIFQMACAACHGGSSGDQITNRAAADETFVALAPDGSVETAVLPDGTIVAIPLTGHTNGNFLNLGISASAYRRQVPPELGGIADPTALPLPHYRLRFYTDATRTQQLIDLPPPPPLLGPNAIPQAFTVDPGRAVISGDPADFEAFDIPQLRGIAHTAPYFHDNSRSTLGAVVGTYSRSILPRIPALGLPAVVPAAVAGQAPESLTATQKTQLIAYLNAI